MSDREWAKPTEVLTTTATQFSKIVEEVWGLLETRNDVFLDPLRPKDYHNSSALNERLQNLLDNIEKYPSDVLMGYLRYSGNWKKSLPAWNPLREATIKQALERNTEEWVDQAFIGLKPGTKLYDYNMKD